MREHLLSTPSNRTRMDTWPKLSQSDSQSHPESVTGSWAVRLHWECAGVRAVAKATCKPGSREAMSQHRKRENGIDSLKKAQTRLWSLTYLDTHTHYLHVDSPVLMRPGCTSYRFPWRFPYILTRDSSLTWVLLKTQDGPQTLTELLHNLTWRNFRITGIEAPSWLRWKVNQREDGGCRDRDESINLGIYMF